MLLKGNSSKISAKGVYKWFRLSHLGKEKSFLMCIHNMAPSHDFDKWMLKNDINLEQN